MSKLDYKKAEPEFYNPPKDEFTIIDIPEMTFFAVDGKGNPGTAQSYTDAVELLYSVSYVLKMKVVKKQDPSMDYVVPPLQGLWHVDDPKYWNMEDKDKWKWRMMIRIPDHVTATQIEEAIEIANEKGLDTTKLLTTTYHEGLAVQIMYIGPYSEEHETIMAMHEFAQEKGYTLHKRHHEIYISDPRKTAPAKLKTIIRQPITKQVL